jgi:hypothetical protein
MRIILSIVVALGLLAGGPARPQSGDPLDQSIVPACAAAAFLWDRTWRPIHDKDDDWLSQKTRDLGWSAVFARRAPAARADLVAYSKAMVLFASDAKAFQQAKDACRAADARRYLPDIPPGPPGDPSACFEQAPAVPILSPAPKDKGAVCHQLSKYAADLRAHMGRLERGELSCQWPSDVYINSAKWRVQNEALLVTLDCDELKPAI